MKLNKSHIRSIAFIIIISGCAVASVIVIGNKYGAYVDRGDTSKTHEEQFPTLRTIDFGFGDDIRGTSTPLHDGRMLYENKALGFSIEYPVRPFQGKVVRGFEDEVMQPYEFLMKVLTTGNIYAVRFSYQDTVSILIRIEPSRFSDIWVWMKHNPSYQKPNTVFMRKNIGDIPVVVTYSVPEFPYTADEFIWREMYMIRDNVLYSVGTTYLPNEEYERIQNSFRFLGNEE